MTQKFNRIDQYNAAAKHALDYLAHLAGFKECSVIDGTSYDENHVPTFSVDLALDTQMVRSIYPVSSMRCYISVSSKDEGAFDGCAYACLLDKCISEVSCGFDLWCGVADPNLHSIGYTGKSFAHMSN